MATNRRRATTDDRHVAPTGGSAVSDGGGRGGVSSGRGGASGYNRRTQSARLAAPSWTCHFLENAAAGASPTSVDFLPVIASVLTQLTASNTRTYGDSGLLTRFTASAIPGMSVADYLKRIVKYGPCSKECYIIAMIYIDRVVSRNAGFLISNWNIHRLLITALLCASKFNDDLFYKNVYFAQVGGVPTAELAALELDFLFLIGFDLKVTTEVYTRYTRQLLHNRDFMDHAYVVALAGFHVYITPVVVEEEERKRKRKCKTAKKASFEILPGGPRLPNTQSSAAAVAAAGSTGEAKSGSTLPKQDEARQQRRRQGPARPKRSQTAPSISAVQVEPRVVVEGASGEAASDAPAANGRPQREDAAATGDAPSGSRRLLSVSSEPTSEPQTRSSPQSPVETAPLVRSVSNGAPPRDRKAMAVALKKLQERKEQEEREIMRGIPVHLRGRFSSASARLQPPSPHELNAVPKAQRRRRRGSAPSLGARLPSDQRIQQLMGRRRLSKQNQPGWVASGNEFAVPTPDLGMTSSGGESGTSPGSSSPSSVRPRRMPRRRGPVGAIIAAGASAGRRHRMAADTTSSDVADASSEALDRSSGGLPGRDGAETLTAPAGRPGALVTERRRSSIDAFLRHQRRTKRRESREAGRGKSSRSRSRSRARFRRQREQEELLVSQAVAIIEQEVADRELDPSLVAMASTFLSERVVQSDVEPKGGDVESGGNDDAAVFKNRKKSQGRRTRTNAGGKNDIAAARARFLRKRRSLKTASLTNLTRQVTTTQAEQASGINVSSSESGSEAPRPRLAASRGLKRASSLGAHMGDGIAGRRRLHRSNSSDMTFSPVTARLWVAFTELVADCAPLSPSLLGRAADVLHIPAATAEALGVQRGISSSSVATSPVHRFDNRVNAPGDGVSPVLHALEANESAAAAAAAAVATLS